MEMDSNKDGTLSLDEFVSGIENIPEMAQMLKLMGVSKEDVEATFSILDSDGSGDVDFREFSDKIYRMKYSDWHAQVSFLRYYATQIHEKVHQQVEMLKAYLERSCNKQE